MHSDRARKGHWSRVVATVCSCSLLAINCADDVLLEHNNLVELDGLCGDKLRARGVEHRGAVLLAIRDERPAGYMAGGVRSRASGTRGHPGTLGTRAVGGAAQCPASCAHLYFLGPELSDAPKAAILVSCTRGSRGLLSRKMLAITVGNCVDAIGSLARGGLRARCKEGRLVHGGGKRGREEQAVDEHARWIYRSKAAGTYI